MGADQLSIGQVLTKDGGPLVGMYTLVGKRFCLMKKNGSS